MIVDGQGFGQKQAETPLKLKMATVMLWSEEEQLNSDHSDAESEKAKNPKKISIGLLIKVLTSASTYLFTSLRGRRLGAS